PLQRGERAAGRSLEGNRGEADGRASATPTPARGPAPARGDGAPGARAERAGEAALGLRSEAVGRRADRPLGVAGLDREHAKGLVTRLERRTDYARRFRQPRTEPGSGWHGLPRRVETERPKEVARSSICSVRARSSRNTTGPLVRRRLRYVTPLLKSVPGHCDGNQNHAVRKPGMRPVNGRGRVKQ